MKSLAQRFPHVERLTARLQTLDGPLIQLWGWPGGGQQAVLDTLIEDARFGQPLSLEDLADETTLRRAVEAAVEGGARWLVLPAVPFLPVAAEESVGTIARLLVPGQRLVFAAPRRRPAGPLAVSHLLPEELLLHGDELSDLWRRVTGSEPGAALRDELLAATDGWYRPLRLAAESAAAAGGQVDPGALHRLPPVAAFLRHEVLGLLDPDEADLLLTVGTGGELAPELWEGVLDAGEEALRRRLVGEWGWVLDGPRGPRLPSLLAAFLEGEAAATLPADRRREIAAGLGRGERAAGRPVAALEHLLAAGDREAVAEVLDEGWLELLSEAPLGTLERAFVTLDAAVGGAGAAETREGDVPAGVAPAAEEPAAEEPAADAPAGPAAPRSVRHELLHLLTTALLWRRDPPAVHLRALQRNAGPDPYLAAALALTRAALGQADGEPAAVVDAEGGPEGAPDGDPARDLVPERLPPALRPLAVVAELTAAPANGDDADPEDALPDDPGSDDEAAASRLVPALERVAPERRPAGLGTAPAAAGSPTAPPLAALFERALIRLLRRRPGLAAELGHRRDLPAAWRRWLVAQPPASLASEPRGYLVDLLGKPEVALRGESGAPREITFALRRAFQVFAYLATSPGFEATRDELVEAVWWDEAEAAVEKNFHPTLSYVRRALRDEGGAQTVELRGGVYRLNPRLAWTVDAVEMARRAEQARRALREGRPEQAVALLQAAWSLYRGPLLAGWDAPWIADRRDELAETYRDVLASLGELCERLDRVTEAMDACRAALIEDPLQERLHLTLMRIYARQGRRDLVRRQYERLSALLSEEMGLEPMAETTEAYHRLMA